MTGPSGTALLTDDPLFKAHSVCQHRWEQQHPGFLQGPSLLTSKPLVPPERCMTATAAAFKQLRQQQQDIVMKYVGLGHSPWLSLEAMLGFFRGPGPGP